MAGDWIKMSTGLRTHPKVVRIARASKTPDKLRVLGALHIVWCIFDEHSEDGYLDGYTLDVIDRETFKGFANALVGVGWLEEEADGLRVPRFDTHNGASAKRRAQETERKRTDRGRKSDDQRTESGQVSASDADEKRTREEKRREEEKPLPPSSSAVPRETEPPPPLPTTTIANGEDSIHRRACDIVGLLRPRGAGVTASDPRVRTWAANAAVTDAALLSALHDAQEARAKARDPTAINAGYLDTILGNVIRATPTYDLEALAKL